MSGGHFDYKQFVINEIAEKLESHLNGDDPLYETYSHETMDVFRVTVTLLKIAHLYAHRIDWLLSGDDSEETFHKRLKEGLKAIDTGKEGFLK